MNTCVLSTKIKLLERQPELRQLMAAFNAACNEVAKVAFETKTFGHRKLRSLVYKFLSKSFVAGYADLIPKRVASVYANKTRRSVLVHFKSTSSVSLDKRVIGYKRDNHVSIRTLNERSHIVFQSKEGAVLSNACESTLSVNEQGQFFVNQAIKVLVPVVTTPDSWLGVDLGIVNVATDSDGAIHSGSQLRNLRRRNNKLRRKLQKVGTKSAKRLLKKRSKRESRFARDVNHCISKQLVKKARDTKRGIGLEDLKGIRDRIKVRRAQRSELSSWSFAQLLTFVLYKATLVGVMVRLVDPRNTSRTCPNCKFVSKKNRPSQAFFKCIQCGCAGHADHFAALEIGRRAAGFQPDVAPVLVATSTEVQKLGADYVLKILARAAPPKTKRKKEKTSNG